MTDIAVMHPNYWALFLEFWSLADPNVVWVLVGSILLGVSASVIGSFYFLRKRALVGDALAHAAVPGVMTAFLLFQSNDPFLILLGAITSSFLGLFLMDWLPKNTKIKPDAAMAITLSFSFALGMMLLSYIQGLEIAGKSGLDNILFGKAAAMLPRDIYLLSVIAILILTFVGLFFQKFRLITFNLPYAKAIGINVVFYEVLLALLIVLAVVIGLQIVGVVLMAAILIAPVAAARFWSHNLAIMLVITGTIGGISGLVSANISYMAPAMPSGPWMVVTLSFIFFLSLIFAPQKGLLSNWKRLRKFRHQVRKENILRTMYILNERHPNNSNNSKTSEPALHLTQAFNVEDILKNRSVPINELKKTLKSLDKQGLISWLAEKQVQLTELGIKQATSLTRKHRLWESYLVEEVNLGSQYIHSRAERIEHLLTEEQADELEKSLKIDGIDPHGKPIPQGGKA